MFLYNHLAFSSQWSARFKQTTLLIIANQESDETVQEVDDAVSHEELDETVEILPMISPLTLYKIARINLFYPVIEKKDIAVEKNGS